MQARKQKESFLRLCKIQKLKRYLAAPQGFEPDMLIQGRATLDFRCSSMFPRSLRKATFEPNFSFYFQ